MCDSISLMKKIQCFSHIYSTTCWLPKPKMCHQVPLKTPVFWTPYWGKAKALSSLESQSCFLSPAAKQSMFNTLRQFQPIAALFCPKLNFSDLKSCTLLKNRLWMFLWALHTSYFFHINPSQVRPYFSIVLLFVEDSGGWIWLQFQHWVLKIHTESYPVNALEDIKCWGDQKKRIPCACPCRGHSQDLEGARNLSSCSQ